MVQAVKRHSRLPRRAQDRHCDFPRMRRRPSDRICMSDDEADVGRLRRHSPGRLSYSDDELSVRQSPRRCSSQCTCCLRKYLLHGTKSASKLSSTQNRNVPLQQEHEGSPRPIRRGCYACSSPAASR